MAAKYRARANALTKKRRQKYRADAMSTIFGALKKSDPVKRKRKAAIKVPPAHSCRSRIVRWRIVSDPEILGGMPVFAGTRVPVKNLIDSLEAGDSFESFLFDFPSVREDTS